MKDVLLLHDNARPHTSLRTCEAVAKMGRTILSLPAHSPDLAPSDCHLFGPVKDVLRRRYFADDSELKQRFRDGLRSRGREFYNTGTQRLTQR
jgi:histone-lysine N-methyltransferase SETMAR